MHAFVEGRPLVLAGVEVPHQAGLSGHSDADVISHAIADALLGAAGFGDIGDRFPATDRWKNASSLEILRDCATEVEAAGWSIANLDATVILEEPKLAPYRSQMTRRVARALGIGPDRVSIKATTTDGLGAVGSKEGIAAMAVVLIERP